MFFYQVVLFFVEFCKFAVAYLLLFDFKWRKKWYVCQTAHCGRYIPHFDFGAKPSPIVPYRHLPQTLSGMTADCRSLV